MNIDFNTLFKQPLDFFNQSIEKQKQIFETNQKQFKDKINLSQKDLTQYFLDTNKTNLDFQKSITQPLDYDKYNSLIMGYFDSIAELNINYINKSISSFITK